MTLVLAVDGGNSKTDVALVDGDGRLLAAVRGRTTSHQQVGADAGMQRLAGLVAEAWLEAGLAVRIVPTWACIAWRVRTRRATSGSLGRGWRPRASPGRTCFATTPLRLSVPARTEAGASS